MSVHLNFEKVSELLHAAVEDRGPEYIYPAEQKDPGPYGEQKICRYVFRGPRGGLQGPGCIVGHVLAAAGVPVKAMALYDVAGSGTITPGVELLSAMREAGRITFDGSASHVLELAQSYQDGGSSWGDAVHDALGPED